MKEKYLIISHDDLDGLAANAIIHQFIKNNNNDNVLIETMFISQRKLGTLNISEDYNQIYILDLVLTEYNVKKVKELDAKYSIVYIDHHLSVYNHKDIIVNGKIIHSGNEAISATKLAYNHVDNTLFSDSFCNLVNDTDSFTFDGLNVSQDKAILTSTFLNNLITKDINDVYNKILNNYFDIYIENDDIYFYKDEIQKEFWLWKYKVEDMYFNIINDGEIYDGFINFNNVNYLLANLLKVRLLEVEQKFDIITFCSDSYLNIFSAYVSRKAFNCHNFTLQYGRGGHPGASGINLKNNGLTKKQIMKDIEMAIKKES